MINTRTLTPIKIKKVSNRPTHTHTHIITKIQEDKMFYLSDEKPVIKINQDVDSPYHILAPTVVYKTNDINYNYKQTIDQILDNPDQIIIYLIILGVIITYITFI